MVFPLIPVIIGATLGGGAVALFSGHSNKKKAQKYFKKATNLYDEVSKKAETLQKKMVNEFEELGLLKKNIIETSLVRYQNLIKTNSNNVFILQEGGGKYFRTH